MQPHLDLDLITRMEERPGPGHMVIVSYGAQGLINPSLQLAHRLLHLQFRVTFLTTVFAHRRIISNATHLPLPHGLRLAAFSDGFDHGFTVQTDDISLLLSQVKSAGPQALRHMVNTSALEGCPVTCLVNTLNLSWVSAEARQLQLPCAHLWVQPCTALGIYYHYFNGFGDLIKDNCADPSWSVHLPGLPSLRGAELPSFMSSPSSDFNEYALQTFKELIQAIQTDGKSILLVNSFEQLEPEAFKSLAVLNPIGIGPLIQESDGTPFRAELFRSKSEDWRSWMQSKPKSSVVYVSFGTLFAPSRQQSVEMARGLLASNRPFLWSNREVEVEEDGLDEATRKELEGRGMIVSWVSQAEVLSSPAAGCFVSHCGWNSVLESLVAGLPVVAIPQSSEQGTNAKLVAEEFGIGERGQKDADGVVGAEEIRRCIDLVMSGQNDDITRNCKKWKELANQAAMESAHKILNQFLKLP